MTKKPNFWKYSVGIVVVILLLIGTWGATSARLTSARNKKGMITVNTMRGAVAAPTPTGTDPITGVIELDGDITDSPSPSPTPDDWASINCGGGNAVVKTGVIADGLNASIFTGADPGGNSKDPDLLSGWRHKNGNVPDKDELINAYAAKYTGSPSGDNILAFGADRYANTGTAFIGFWFFKNPVFAAEDGLFREGPLATDTIASHAVGDLLVLIEFTQGGALATAKVFEWVGSGGSESGGTLDDITGTAPLGAVFSISNGLPEAIPGSCAAWVHDPKSGPDGTIQTNAFFEGAINIDAFPALAGSCFSSFLVETRSAASVTATLKDFVLGQFNTCVDIDVSKSADNEEVCEGATTTYTYVVRNLSGVPADITLVDDNETLSTADDLDVGGNSNCAAVPVAGPTSFTLQANDNATGGPDEQTFICTRQLSLGTHTNVVTATGTFGSSSDTATATETVTVHPNPSANAGPDQAACALTASHQFQMAATATTVPGGDLTWSVVSKPPGSTVTFATSNKVEDPLVTVNAFGVYTLRLTSSNPETGPSCSPAFDDVVVTLFQSPVADAGDDASACEDTASHVFQITGTGGTVVPAGGSILWTVESGSATITAGEEDDLNPHVTLTAFGSAVLKMTVVNPQTGITAGCGNADDTVVLTLNQNPVITIADVSCNAADGGTSINLVAQVTAAGSSGTNAFVWKKNGVVIVGQTTDTLNVTTPGVYTVEVTRSHTDGSVSCMASKSKNVGLCASDAAPPPP